MQSEQVSLRRNTADKSLNRPLKLSALRPHKRVYSYTTSPSCLTVVVWNKKLIHTDKSKCGLYPRLWSERGWILKSRMCYQRTTKERLPHDEMRQDEMKATERLPAPLFFPSPRLSVQVALLMNGLKVNHPTAPFSATVLLLCNCSKPNFCTLNCGAWRTRE